MSSKNLLIRVTTLLIVGLVSACSSAGTLTVTQPKTQGIPPGQTVSLAVAVDVAEPLPVHQEVATRVRERLFGRLVSDGIFRAVVLPPEPADYHMDVKIRGAREVSTGARIMLGAIIGPRHHRGGSGRTSSNDQPNSDSFRGEGDLCGSSYVVGSGPG